MTHQHLERKGAPSVGSWLAASSLLPWCFVACVSGPDLSRAPRVEIHFPAAPRAAKTETPKPDAAKVPKADNAMESSETVPPMASEPEAPDPLARSSRAQLRLHLKVSERKLTCSQASRVTLAEERVTPRRFGRFALEAYQGTKLIERLRFDFPLLLGTNDLDEMEAGLETEVRIEFPDLPEVTRLEVRDRKTREIVVLPSADKLIREPASVISPSSSAAAK